MPFGITHLSFLQSRLTHPHLDDSTDSDHQPRVRPEMMNPRAFDDEHPWGMQLEMRAISSIPGLEPFDLDEWGGSLSIFRNWRINERFMGRVGVFGDWNNFSGSVQASLNPVLKLGDHFMLQAQLGIGLAMANGRSEINIQNPAHVSWQQRADVFRRHVEDVARINEIRRRQGLRETPIQESLLPGEEPTPFLTIRGENTIDLGLAFTAGLHLEFLVVPERFTLTADLHLHSYHLFSPHLNVYAPEDTSAVNLFTHLHGMFLAEFTLSRGVMFSLGMGGHWDFEEPEFRMMAALNFTVGIFARDNHMHAEDEHEHHEHE